DRVEAIDAWRHLPFLIRVDIVAVDAGVRGTAKADVTADVEHVLTALVVRRVAPAATWQDRRPVRHDRQEGKFKLEIVGIEAEPAMLTGRVAIAERIGVAARQPGHGLVEIVGRHGIELVEGLPRKPFFAVGGATHREVSTLSAHVTAVAELDHEDA